MLSEIIISVSLSMSGDSQLMLFSFNSVLSVLSIPGVLNWFLHLFVLDLFVFDVLVYCFYICFENRDNGYYSYAVIESKLFVYCYSLSS